MKRQMQGENASQCRPLASVFNAADAVLGRKSRQNVDCQHALQHRCQRKTHAARCRRCGAGRRKTAGKRALGQRLQDILSEEQKLSDEREYLTLCANQQGRWNSLFQLHQDTQRQAVSAA